MPIINFIQRYVGKLFGGSKSDGRESSDLGDNAQHITVFGTKGCGKTTLIASLIDFDRPNPRWHQRGGKRAIPWLGDYRIGAADKEILRILRDSEGIQPTKESLLLCEVFINETKLQFHDLPGEWIDPASDSFSKALERILKSQVLILCISPKDLEVGILRNQLCGFLQTLRTNRYRGWIALVLTQSDRYWFDNEQQRIPFGFHELGKRGFGALKHPVFELGGIKDVLEALRDFRREDGRGYWVAAMPDDSQYAKWEHRGTPQLFRDVFEILHREPHTPLRLFWALIPLTVLVISIVLFGYSRFREQAFHDIRVFKRPESFIDTNLVLQVLTGDTNTFARTWSSLTNWAGGSGRSNTNSQPTSTSAVPHYQLIAGDLRRWTYNLRAAVIYDRAIELLRLLATNSPGVAIGTQLPSNAWAYPLLWEDQTFQVDSPLVHNLGSLKAAITNLASAKGSTGVSNIVSAMHAVSSLKKKPNVEKRYIPSIKIEAIESAKGTLERDEALGLWYRINIIKQPDSERAGLMEFGKLNDEALYYSGAKVPSTVTLFNSQEFSFQEISEGTNKVYPTIALKTNDAVNFRVTLRDSEGERDTNRLRLRVIGYAFGDRRIDLEAFKSPFAKDHNDAQKAELQKKVRMNFR